MWRVITHNAGHLGIFEDLSDALDIALEHKAKTGFPAIVEQIDKIECVDCDE